MFESNVRTVLKDYAARLRAIPERERDYEVCKALEEKLNKTLPEGWEGWVASNAVTAAEIPTEDPDVTGQPVEVKYLSVYLDNEDVKEEVILKHPSDCCIFCGTPRLYFEGWECPTCGAV